MLKFMVVLHRRPDRTREQFRHHLEQIHASLARALPGLLHYKQNHILEDRKRNPPGWDAIIELYFEDWETMEAAWSSPQGAASDADLPRFADMSCTTWSVVEELTLL